jgi:hypothetical protein
MITDPNGMWKDEGDGNWTAEKGDSWWKLHKQSGMSWEETMDYAKKYNADKGRDNWKSVRVGDQVSVPRSEKESSSASGGGENASASTSTSNYLPTPISSSGETANPAQTINNVNSIINVFLTSAQATLQTTRIGSNLSFVIANNKLALNGVTNGLKFAPYIGLGVTTLTGSYLSKTINPTTGRPYQSWLETGFDSGASAATIVIAAKYGGWFGAGAAMLYIGGKEGIKANVRTVRKHPDRFLPASVHCFTR